MWKAVARPTVEDPLGNALSLLRGGEAGDDPASGFLLGLP
jgi:hypothetical protein